MYIALRRRLPNSDIYETYTPSDQWFPLVISLSRWIQATCNSNESDGYLKAK